MRSNDYSREASLGRRRAQRSSSRRRGAAGLLALALAGALAVGGTVAWLSASTSAVTNTFEPGEVTTEIVEGFDGKVKSDVKITNTGDVPAYVRAKVVVNWVDAGGKVAASVPEGYGFTMSPDLEKTVPSGWLKGDDGFWYYSKALKAADDAAATDAEKETASLLGRVTASYPQGVDAEGAEYHLSVEVLDESIQALPDDAFNESWGGSSGLTASDGELTETKKTTA